MKERAHTIIKLTSWTRRFRPQRASGGLTHSSGRLVLLQPRTLDLPCQMIHALSLLTEDRGHLIMRRNAVGILQEAVGLSLLIPEGGHFS